MNNDNKKLDEVKETIAKEEIENKTHEEKIESEDTMQRISEKDIHKDVNVKSKKFKVGITIGIIVLIVIIGGILYWWISNKKLVDSYENKVYPEVYIYSEPVGELNEADLSKILAEKDAEIANKTIKVTVNGKEYSSSYTELDVTTDTDKVKDEIMSYGKNKSFKGKLNLINEPK